MKKFKYEIKLPLKYECMKDIPELVLPLDLRRDGVHDQVIGYCENGSLLNYDYK